MERILNVSHGSGTITARANTFKTGHVTEHVTRTKGIGLGGNECYDPVRRGVWHRRKEP